MQEWHCIGYVYGVLLIHQQSHKTSGSDTHNGVQRVGFKYTKLTTLIEYISYKLDTLTYLKLQCKMDHESNGHHTHKGPYKSPMDHKDP